MCLYVAHIPTFVDCFVCVYAYVWHCLLADDEKVDAACAMAAEAIAMWM